MSISKWKDIGEILSVRKETFITTNERNRIILLRRWFNEEVSSLNLKRRTVRFYLKKALNTYKILKEISLDKILRFENVTPNDFAELYNNDVQYILKYFT
jgi:16S rRNA A1518/A1519 N6-dimethyltransferase RsmA/KsgA/DIM1 with predicted DNA glycosylase/AP lyase activity